MSDELLSVIIPVYNTKKWLGRCLDSILAQSYANLEIICVDDGATDGSAQILEEYAKRDGRIVIIKHEKNRGLFRARVTGMQAAHGSYIAFVDSDDFVACDWFYPLLKKAAEENADMSIGNTVNIDEQGRKTYYNFYRRFNTGRASLAAPALLPRFFAQHGECFVWHTVWNKVYSQSLIERALPYFEGMKEPLIMGEDIAFSSVFYALADRLSFCDNDCYFYYRHSEASTSLSLPRAKIVKNLEDIVQVFAFVKNFLEEIHEFDELSEDYALFKEKYYIIWSGNVRAAGLHEDGQVRQIFLDGFGKPPVAVPSAHEFFFYEKSSDWDGGLEALKQSILQSKCEYVSFDVFDTLLLRPLWEPNDLFKMVEKECGPIAANFSFLRPLAEFKCRERKKAIHKEDEDVTLAEIYAFLVKEYGIAPETAEALRAAELRTEERLCSARRCGVELYELARRAGKKIICISDMYLEEDFVAGLLKKCGFADIERVFVSSQRKKLKATGRLYAAVCAELNTSPQNILHIGDNYVSDVKKSAEAGMQSLYLPKTVDVFTNRVADVYTGDSFKDIYWGNNGLYDSRGVIDQLPLRCMYAVVANRMFDQPFRAFDRHSTYNADPYYMGYMAAGMHLFGLAKWIYDVSLREGYDTVHFFARDGYVVKQIFDRISSEAAKRGGRKVGSSYFCATRRALMPYCIRKRSDIYNLAGMVDFSQQTPQDILERIGSVCREMTESAAEEYAKRGFSFEERFRTKADFVRFLNAVAEISLDEAKAEEEFDRASRAFRAQFSGKCAAFDIGYSGRLQSIVSDLAGKPVDVFYLHSNGSSTESAAKEHGFRVHCFYDFSPYITGILRETLLSETAPSCIGYRFEGEEISFVYEEARGNGYSETFALREIHRGALDFAADALALLGEDILRASFRPLDVSAALENMFLNATLFDCAVFANTAIEDKVFSGYEKRSFYDTLMWYRENRPATNVVYVDRPVYVGESAAKTRLGRALYYLLFDRKKFFAKVKAKLKRK